MGRRWVLRGGKKQAAWLLTAAHNHLFKQRIEGTKGVLQNPELY
jgi:hypothetical protein